MKEMRDDTAKRTNGERENEMEKQPEGAPSRRVSDLDEQQREQVADKALSGPGGALPYRDEMEARFGRSFGGVTVSSGAESREALGGLGASGVSRDQAVAFRDASPSREVVAHELTHVVQASGGRGGSSADAEREAYGAERGGLPKATAGGAGVAHFRDDLVDHSAQEHHGPKSPFRNPEDEKPADWNSNIKLTTPSAPYVVYDVIPGPKCPLPPDGVLEKAPSHHQRDPDEPMLDHKEGSDPPIQLGQWKLDQRQAKWDEYRKVATKVHSTQTSLAPDVNLFFDARHNPELTALGFTKGKGTIIDRANQQEVPNRGGQSVGGLFKADNTLNTTKRDDHAIASAVKHGHLKGRNDNAFVATQAADYALQKAVDHAKADASDLSAAKAGLDGAIAGVNKLDATRAAEKAREEIESLKKEAEACASVLEFVVKSPTRLFQFAETEEKGGKESEGIDPLETIGSVGAMLLNAFPSAQLQAAQARLRQATEKKEEAETEIARSVLETAKQNVSAAVSRLAASREGVSEKLAARRVEYNIAGDATAAVADGDAASKGKVAAIISAIPVVESVVGAITNIVGKTTDGIPTYSQDAGVGYGISLHHQTDAAWMLPLAVGSIASSGAYFGDLLVDWQQRLQTLLAKKSELSGVEQAGCATDQKALD